MKTLDRKLIPPTEVELAITGLRTRLNDDPNNVPLRVELAQLLERSRDFLSAVKEYRKLVEIDPQKRGEYDTKIRLNSDYATRELYRFERGL